MAVSKVTLNGTTLIDVTSATAQAENIHTPHTAMLADGVMTTGTGFSSGVQISVSSHINSRTGEWVRPQEYPNLDNIEMPSDFDGVYLTYDLRKTPDYGWIGVSTFFTGNSGTAAVERGHLENNVFIADETYTMGHNSPFKQVLDDSYGDVQLWRVYATDGEITRFDFRCLDNMHTQYLQPCVEATGRLMHLTEIRSDVITIGNSYVSWGTFWLERDSRKCGGAVTSMYQPWMYCYSLQSLDVSGWDTSDWAVTSLSSAFRDCYSLPHLDLSSWNTSNWAVTTISSCWYSCYALKDLIISGWNTSNWAITNLSSCWQSCHSLLTLDLSGWDTSNWEVTTLSSCWSSCYSLQYINMDGWDTSGWAVTNMSYCWQNCTSLVELDLSGWNTEDWAVTTLQTCWNNCRTLKSIDFTGWDTSNWAVTELSSAFGACWALETLDLSPWDTSEWEVTGIGGLFSECFSLRSINMTGWDTSNWAVKSTQDTFRSCISLVALNLSGWDTSGWPITNMTNMFAYSNTLRSIKGTSTWTCIQNLSNQSAWYINIAQLEDFDGAPFTKSTGFGSCNKLTRESLLKIIDKLETVESTQTLSLGTNNKNKLTAEEIAVATAKGWTVTA